MKKIISMAVAAVLMVSALSALELEFGARGILGRNLDKGSFKDNVAQAKEDKTFDAGFGVYGMFALFGNLGIQAEANYVKSSMNFNVKDENGKTQKKEYEIHTLDLAPMVWLNLPLGKLAIGLGAGPNFSIPVAQIGDVKNAKKDDFKMGVIGGADFKFYFTDHLGLVLSGRYVAEWEKRNATITAYGQEVETPLPEYSFNRKTIYGGVGLEFKLL